MDNKYNEYLKKQYELFEEETIRYHDVITDILGQYKLCFTDAGSAIIKTNSNKIFLCNVESLDKRCISISSWNDYTWDNFRFESRDDRIIVSETKIDLYETGVNVEVIRKFYGTSKYDNDKKVLVDLESHNYIIQDYFGFDDLIDIEFLQKRSLLTTDFSVHMKYIYKMEGELRSIVSSIYPSLVYFNGKDISHVYDFVDGADKVSRIYNLYTGNVKKDSDDIKTIITGLVDKKSFNYRNKCIGSQIRKLIGEPRYTDDRKIALNEYVDQQLREEENNKTIDSTYSLNSSDNNSNKSSSKVIEFVRKLALPRK